MIKSLKKNKTMCAYEIEALYYSFTLYEDVILDDYARNNFTKKTVTLNHCHIQIGRVISENITKKKISESSDRVVVIHTDPLIINKVKDFCNFLLKDNFLHNIVAEHITKKFDINAFAAKLNTAYEVFEISKNTRNQNSIKKQNKL